MELPPASPDSCSEHDGWGAVVDEFLQSSQEDSDQAVLADACKSESCSQSSGAPNPDESSSSSESRKPQPVAWWAQLLKLHTRQFQVPTQKRPTTLVSACAGIFTEGEAFKAGGRES